ncbi:hypothetical protein ACFLWS_01455 [Chloroflexota bacterium]
MIVVEANYGIGGHAILSAANIALGGGTSAQKKYGIVDSPDLVFQDLTDWSIVETNGMPEYRYNSFVDTGIDLGFGKPTPLYKIETPPFYAAWASPVVHDAYAGLRVNMQCQVLNVNGEVIPIGALSPH